MTNERLAELVESIASTQAVRRTVMAIDHTGWTRQQWIDEARDIMDHLHGSVECLLNGHVLALLSAVAASEEQALSAYRAGFAAGRADYQAAVARAFEELIGGQP